MEKIATFSAGNDIMRSPIAARVLATNGDIGALKPWEDDNTGQCYVTLNAMSKNAKNVLATNATLRKDEWKQYDTAVVKIARDRLVGVKDLMSRGLVFRIGNGLGKTVLEYEDQSDMSAANLSMDAITRGDKDRLEYDINYLPLPVIHKDFSLNIRNLNASRTTGQPLDVAMAEIAAIKVAEKMETILFTGSGTFTYGGGVIYGYTDFPSRNTVTLSTDWDASAATGTIILDDVRAMKQASIDAKHFGPWVLYVPGNYETVLDDDFKTNSDKTIRQRIMELKGVQDVVVSDYLTDDNVLLVEMNAQTVRMVEGLPIQTVEWSTEGGMVTNYKVMTINVPQMRADQDGNCGITHLS